MIYFILYVILILMLEAAIDMPHWVQYIWGVGMLLIYFGGFYRQVLRKEIKYRVLNIEEKQFGKRRFWLWFKNEEGRDDWLVVEQYIYEKVNEGEVVGVIYRGTHGLIIVKSNGSVIRTKWYWYLISKNEKHIKAVCVELLKAVRASNKK